MENDPFKQTRKGKLARGLTGAVTTEIEAWQALGKISKTSGFRHNDAVL